MGGGGAHNRDPHAIPSTKHRRRGSAQHSTDLLPRLIVVRLVSRCKIGGGARPSSAEPHTHGGMPTTYLFAPHTAPHAARQHHQVARDAVLVRGDVEARAHAPRARTSPSPSPLSLSLPLSPSLLCTLSVRLSLWVHVGACVAVMHTVNHTPSKHTTSSRPH